MRITPEHNERIAKMTFESVYPHYIKKVECKGRTIELVHCKRDYFTMQISGSTKI